MKHVQAGALVAFLALGAATIVGLAWWTLSIFFSSGLIAGAVVFAVIAIGVGAAVLDLLTERKEL